MSQNHAHGFHGDVRVQLGGKADCQSETPPMAEKMSMGLVVNCAFAAMRGMSVGNTEVTRGGG